MVSIIMSVELILLMLGKLESIMNENCQLFNMGEKQNLITVLFNLLQKEKKNIVGAKGAEQQQDFSAW